MASRKHNTKRKMCPVNVACEDITIPEEADMCGKCREALRKRAKSRTQPLRGERIVTYMEQR